MRTIIYIILASVIFTSCEKIVAKDISNETPVVLLPVANDTVEINPVHFKREGREGAT